MPSSPSSTEVSIQPQVDAFWSELGKPGSSRLG